MTIAPWKANQSHQLSERGLYSLAMAEDGLTLAVGDGEGLVSLFNPSTFLAIKKARLSTTPIRWLGYIKQTLIVVSDFNKIQSYNSELQAIGKPYHNKRNIQAFTAHQDGLILADSSGTITYLNSKLEFLQMTLTTYKISTLFTSNDHLWIGTQEGSVIKMKKHPALALEIVDLPKQVAVRTLTLLPTGFAAGSSDSQIHVWNEKKNAFDCSHSVRSNHLATVGKELFSAGFGKIHFNFSALKNPRKIRAHGESEITALAYSPCLTRIFSAGMDGKLVSWQRDVQN